MVKGCDAFISGWNDEVEQALMKRENNVDIEDHICYKLTHVRIIIY